MYHYLVDVIKGGSRSGPVGQATRGGGGTISSSGSAAAAAAVAATAADEARRAQQREDERARCALQERRRAYTAFMTGTSLGQLLAPHMPAAGRIATTEQACRSAFSAAAAITSGAEAAAAPPPTFPFASPLRGPRTVDRDAGSFAHTGLEQAMYHALAPVVSCTTALMTRRVLTAPPHPTSTSVDLSAGELVSSAARVAPLAASQHSSPRGEGPPRTLTRDDAAGAALPFLLIAEQLNHWHACLTSLSTLVRDGATVASPQLACALQQLCHILAALTCATEVQAAHVRLHLGLLSDSTTACVGGTLQCLRRLTRLCGSEEFAMPTETEPAAATAVTGRAGEQQQFETEVASSTRRDDASDAVTGPAVDTDPVEVQACRLLSLLLYWMHLVNGIEAPSLAATELYLSASSAAHPAVAAAIVAAAAAPDHETVAEKESRRCTGLSNVALVCHAHDACTAVPLEMLSLAHDPHAAGGDQVVGGSGSRSASGGAQAAGVSSSPRDVASSLAGLLLSASKGVVVAYASPSAGAPSTLVDGTAVQEDADLGLLVVLSSRLLRHMFAASTASPSPPDLVRKVASSLLSTLSILLARFIAGDRDDEEAEQAGTLVSGEGAATPATPLGSARRRSVHEMVDPVTGFSYPSPPPSPTRNRRSSVAAAALSRLQRPTRQLRLLGQLSGGLVLVTALLEQNATSVLDTMDHSFFFDALVTALQVIGTRFTEPTQRRPVSATAAAPLVPGKWRCADAWLSWVGAVEAVAAGSGPTLDAAAGTGEAGGAAPHPQPAVKAASVALSHALTSCVSQFSFDVLSCDPFVDEFLHAYLGLLAASRLLRVYPCASTSALPRNVSLGSTSTASSGVWRREGRALDTLDQLELTLVKTFVTAYDASAELAAAAAAATTELSTALPPSLDQTTVGVDSLAAGSSALGRGGGGGGGGDDGLAGLSFPFTSCLYKLLLKHAFWCLDAAERRRGVQAFPPLLPPPPPPPSTAPAPLSPQHGNAPSLLRLSPGPTTAANTPGLAAQPPPSPPMPSLPRSPWMGPELGAAPVFFAYASHDCTGGGTGQDCDPLSFLVRHGLLRILLHDHHFAPAFATVELTSGPEDAAASSQERGSGGEAADRAPTMCERSHAVLFLLAHCLQIHPRSSGGGGGWGTCGCTSHVAAAAHEQRGDCGDVEGLGGSATSSGGAPPPPGARSESEASASNDPVQSSPREQQLAQETVGALVEVLRAAAAAVPLTMALWQTRPLAAQRRRRRWCDCLTALLATAMGAPRPGVLVPVAGDAAPQKVAGEVAVVPAASASVSAALLRAGGVEFLLRAALASAGAASTRSHGAAGASATAAAAAVGTAVSYAWAMQATQCLAADPNVRVYLALNCTKSLVLPLLWHPLLRAEGQQLLQTLLCQPLAGVSASADTGTAAAADLREVSPSLSSSGLAAGSDGAAAAAVQAVPRHCRRLCEGVWRVLCDCVNGLASTGSEADLLESVVSEDDNAEERHLVLRAVLRALVTAFRTLSGLRRGDGDLHAGELLPLRTLQRGLFEVSREAGLNIYGLLMHRLAQSWKALDGDGSGGDNDDADDDDETVSGARIAAWAGGMARTPAESTMSFLCPASGSHSAVDMLTAAPTEASAAVPASLLAPSRSAREVVRLIVTVLVGMTQANPTQRELLYRHTVDEETLLDCIANAWGASGGDSFDSSETSRFVGPANSRNGGDVCGLVQVCSYLVYEAVDAVDAFFAEASDGAGGNSCTRPWQWSLQNPLLLAALLRRFVRLPALTARLQAALGKLLTSLTRTVEGCYASLYLAASSAVHDVLEQLLPVLALVPEPTSGPRGATATAAPSQPLQLDVVLVRLLVSLTRCHVDVRQLKQLLVLVIHTKQQRDRRALVPLILQVLSEAAQAPPGAPLHHVVRRDPRHFVAFQRGRGPAGFRAALPDFPLEGYSVALNLRWEGELARPATAADAADAAAAAPASSWHTAAAAGDDGDVSSCLVSLRTADRSTLLALMVERRTGRLFVQYRNLQQQEMRANLAAVLPSREWTHLCVLHRPAASLTAAAGGQLVLFVNGVEAAVVPQLVYPLMSRGYLFVGCLGHEVDRLSVAHAFYGQVSTTHFFPFVVTDRDREALLTAARLADASTWMSSSSTTSTAAASASMQRPGAAGATANAAASAQGRRPAAALPSAAESAAAGAVGAEQWLAARAIVCVDTRLSDRGHLYNLSAVLRGRGGRDSRLFTLEGSVACSTQRVMDSMGLLGALRSVVMPLCTLLVNPSLPISSRVLVAAPPHGSSVHRDPRLPAASSPSIFDASAHVSAATRMAQDAVNATVLRVLELVPALASVEAIRNEMVEAGLFVFLGQVLQQLGPSLQVVVPAAFVQLLEAVAPFPRLFEDALTNLFLSADVIRAAPRAVQLTWVNVQRSFLRAHPDALPCLRSLGTSMFVAAELLRVTAEEAVAEEGPEAELASATPTAPPRTLVPATATSPFLSPFASLTMSPATGAAAQQPPQPLVLSAPLPLLPPSQATPSCSLLDLEHQWMTYLEALTVAPVTLGDAEALQYFVENLHWTCRTAAVQLRLLRRVRRLLVASRTPYLVQLLGRKNYVVSLIPYLSCAASEAVRLEALLQLLFMVLRSRRTQELMNPLLLASRDTVVHVAEEVSLSWLKDELQEFPVTLPVYMAFRCALVEQFDMPEVPLQYVPLGETHALRFAAVLLPLLMLLKRSRDTTLRGYALTDLAVLLKSDTQAWRRVTVVRGWYVAVVGLFATTGTSLSSPTSPSSPAALVSEVPSTPSLPPQPPMSSGAGELCASGLAFTTTSMIVAHTLFQVLLHETYGAAELELVVAYLRGQRLHRLLHQVLCGIADRYRGRLVVGSRGGGSGGDGGVGRPALSPTASPVFLGLGSAVAVVNLCHFLRLTELVLFYTGQQLRRDPAAAAQAPHPPFTPASSPPSGGDGFAPQRTGYTEWEELVLVRVGDAGEEGDVYLAGEDADPHGDVRRAVLRDPDGRWLHLPLAVKCAELLCTHSALLHLGSNGNSTGLVAGAVAGASGSGGSGGPGDALLSVVLAASGSTGLGGPIAGAASSGGGHGGGSGSRGIPLVLRGGMLRLFGRLFGVVCQMTLRDEAAQGSIVDLADAFLSRVDRGQRGAGFLVLKRTVSAEDAREHSPIATAMAVVRGLHNLLLRRLHASEFGPASNYPSANAALVDRLKSIVAAFRSSFEQLPAFAASAATLHASNGAPLVRRRSSLQFAATWLTRGASTRGSGTGSGDTRHPPSPSASRPGSTYLQDLTGEVFTAGVPTLQWLCDPHANPRRTVEAFAEVASRVDYNAFIERCLLAVEREELTDKALAADLWPQPRVAVRRLQELFAENSVSRRLVQDKIRTLMAARGLSREKRGGGAEGDGDGEAGQGRAPNEDSTASSFTSLFLPSAARRATAAARASVWARFAVALRGTVWSVDAAYQQRTNVKYVRLSSQEQQPLVRRKLVYDREGTNFSGRAMTLYSAPTSPMSNETASARAARAGAGTGFLGDSMDGTNKTASSGSTQQVSRLRLRGGEAQFLSAMDEEDAGLEDDMISFGALDEDGSNAGAGAAATASVGERSLQSDEAVTGVLPRSASALPGDDLPAAPSILSVPCEMPYMMHCWSGSFTVRGSEAIVLFDEVNKAYNQVVAEDARAFVLRPRPFSFHLSHITQIAPGRRFRMRRTALEIWTRDRDSCFLNFADTATMNAALQAVRSGSVRSSYMLMASSFLSEAPGTGATAGALPALLRDGAVGGASRPSAYVLQENPRREPLRLRAMALWRNRQLSNFDYLLVLNLLAGRTVNDLTQYPVFPWVLADFTSETLDLANPATFRDLSLPMGACGTEDRREMVRQRYVDMRDLGDVPSHYFTHYSSPAIALYFLIRLPPFTTLSLLLQGGHFDHADRMFHSVQASFRAVMTSTQDVRELVPELYYLPELCMNANRVDFGRRQDRTSMDDLHLPPWAGNDPFTFVYRMREALESAHVSAHLHEWIDLIFGYKQRGKDAIEALNVFNWHSYEELDRNRETSAADRQLLVDSLDNIGQTPIQLFRRPHQPRPPLEWADPLQLPTHVKVLTPRWGCARVARATVLATDRVLVVSGSGAAASQRMHLNLLRRPTTSAQLPGTGGSTAAGAAGMMLPPSVTAATPPSGTATEPALFAGAATQRRARSPAGRLESAISSLSLTAMAPGVGHSTSAPPTAPLSPVMMGRAVAPPVGDSGSFDVGEEYERRIAPIPAGVIPNNSLYADGSCTEASTALLCYESEVFLVLGGLFDNSVVIRALSGAAGDVRLRAHRGRVLFVARSEDSRYIVTGAEDTTFAVWSCQLQRARQQLEVELLFIVYGHQDMPTAVDVSSTLDVVATASLDGTMMLHSLSTGSLDRVIRHPRGAPIHRILLQSTCYLPNIVFMSHQDERVYQYSLNGAALRTFTPPGRVTAWASTSDQCLLVACHSFATGHGTPLSATPSRGSVTGESPSCILYLHAFFMDVRKTVLLRPEHVVSSVSAHPSHPQVALAGTESGRLLLLRSVAAL